MATGVIARFWLSLLALLGAAAAQAAGRVGLLHGKLRGNNGGSTVPAAGHPQHAEVRAVLVRPTLATQAAPRVPFEACADAHDGFGGPAPLHLRDDVPGGTQPGRGVDVGGNPAAQPAVALRPERFMRPAWTLP